MEVVPLRQGEGALGEALRILGEFGANDPKFDYLSDPDVDRISRNVEAAGARIRGMVDVACTVIEAAFPG